MPALFYHFWKDVATHLVIYSYSTVPLPCGLRPPSSAKSSVHFPVKHFWLATFNAPRSTKCEALRHFHYRPPKSFACVILRGLNPQPILSLRIALPTWAKYFFQTEDELRQNFVNFWFTKYSSPSCSFLAVLLLCIPITTTGLQWLIALEC